MYKINIVPKPNCDNVVKGLLDALEKNNLYIKKSYKKNINLTILTLFL